MARMRITGGDAIEQLVELQVARVRIGRGRDNDIVLPDPEKGVSRTHAELRMEHGRYVVVDLQSQNGTWVNGRRVERADVPYGAEIAVGAYRLTLLDERAVPASPQSRAPRIDPLDDLFVTERHDAAMFRPASAAPPAAAAPRRWGLAASVIVMLGMALAAMAWVSSSKAGSRAAGDSGSSAAARTPDAPAAAAPDAAAAPAERADTPGAGAEPAARRPGEGLPAMATRPVSGPRVTRRPGESVEAWRSREAALQTRYGYSKAALDRGDYSAAAGGFEAILLEEPGFLDAPRLLVQAQAGLRANARALFEAGTKLDQAGDWLGALQKYEQARQVHAGLPGVADRIARVQGRLRAAGVAAITRAKQYEAEGRLREALAEYEKAVQWLPADDPNRQIARARIEQLKKND